MIVIGMMSGTSTDGIDAVVVQLDAPLAGARAPQWQLLAHTHTDFDAALRQEILACLRADSGTVDRLCALNFELGERYAAAALEAIHRAGLTPEQVDLIGNHGQTVWHIPLHSTLQIGSAAVIAERTGITTVSNLRARDVAAGGHGAPMVAYVDMLLFADAREDRVLQNIGGIANSTFLPANQPEEAFAFDSGPGNALIDVAVTRLTDGAQSYDRDGQIAAQGRPAPNLLAELMQIGYLREPPPKTTGRELFGTPFALQVWERARQLGISGQDLVATLTLFTARSIAQSYRDFMPRLPAQVIVSGGGAKNPTLLRMLQAELPVATRVRRIDEWSIPADAKEALAFAILAYETWHARPSNLPNATGAKHAVIQGDITPGRNWSSQGAASLAR